MNTTQLVLWTGLLTTILGAASLSQDTGEKQKEKKKSGSAVSRFFDEQSAELAQTVEGTWTLIDYTDPHDLSIDDTTSGFATFHDGFLSLVLAMDTYHSTILGARQFLIVDSGLYRYRFDEQANLQMASVMSFTNQTSDGEMSRLPNSRVREYIARLDGETLELRDPDGIVFSFRKITAGEFPDSAVRKLDRRRSGTDQWPPMDGR